MSSFDSDFDAFKSICDNFGVCENDKRYLDLLKKFVEIYDPMHLSCEQREKYLSLCSKKRRIEESCSADSEGDISLTDSPIMDFPPILLAEQLALGPTEMGFFASQFNTRESGDEDIYINAQSFPPVSFQVTEAPNYCLKKEHDFELPAKNHKSRCQPAGEDLLKFDLDITAQMPSLQMPFRVKIHMFYTSGGLSRLMKFGFTEYFEFVVQDTNAKQSFLQREDGRVLIRCKPKVALISTLKTNNHLHIDAQSKCYGPFRLLINLGESEELTSNKFFIMARASK